MCCLSKILECSPLGDAFYEWNFNSYRTDSSQIQGGRLSSPSSSSSSSSSCVHDDLGPEPNNPCKPSRSSSTTDIAARCGSPVMPRGSRPEGRINGAPLTSGVGIAEVVVNSNNSNSSSGLSLVVKKRKTLRNILLDAPESCKKEDQVPTTSNILPENTNKSQKVDMKNIRAQPCSFQIPFGKKNSSILRQLSVAYINIGRYVT